MNKLKKYVFNVLISADQFINAVLLGDPDETISSRLGKWLEDDIGWRKNIADVMCTFLWLFDPNHCAKSVELDEGRDSLARSLGE